MLLQKYKNFIGYFVDIKERLVHIEDKINAIQGISNNENTNSIDNIEIDIVPRNKSVFTMALVEGGGVGDAIMDTQLLKAIAMMSQNKIRIDFYCRSYKQFKNYPFIDNSYPYLEDADKSKYDLILIGHRFMIINHMDDTAVKKYSPVLLQYCYDCRKLIEHDMANILNDNLITQYALLKGKKRIEQCNINDIIPEDRFSSKYMPLDTGEFKILRENGLLGKKYVVINRAVDEKYGNNHPKLWPLNNYNKLVRMLKEKYPDILFVLLGDSEKFDPVSLIDVNLVAKTSLEQCKVILKHSICLIAGEGGLVHMRNFLYGKSVVIFGPTLPEIFGYDENINLRGNGCPRTCEWVTDKWADGCILGYDKPKCIHSINVNSVFEATCKLIESNKEIVGRCENCLLYNGKINIEEYLDVINFGFKAKVCIVGESITDNVLRLSEKSELIDIFVDQTHPVDRCHFIRENYGSIYNIPAFDETYDLAIYNGNRKTDYYFALKELLRVVKQNGVAVLIVEKKYISLVKDAMQSMEIKVRDSLFNYDEDSVYLIRRK